MSSEWDQVQRFIWLDKQKNSPTFDDIVGKNDGKTSAKQVEKNEKIYLWFAKSSDEQNDSSRNSYKIINPINGEQILMPKEWFVKLSKVEGKRPYLIKKDLQRMINYWYKKGRIDQLQEFINKIHTDQDEYIKNMKSDGKDN